METQVAMSQAVKERFTAYASLCGLGRQVVARRVLKPLTALVQIAQKRVRYSPVDKLKDALLNLLAGGTGVVEVNKLVRSDVGLQRAFGRTGCAEQSVIQDTLDACTAENVTQMQQAVAVIYRQQSQGYRHDYESDWQLLDVDMTGRPCGRKAELATPGYFAHQRNRRGRQMGYVTATWYAETVVARLFAGREQLTTALRPLLEAAAETLHLDRARRCRTIVRVDAGGGSVDDINWLLGQGYQVHSKDFSTARARNLAHTVQFWWPDPYNSKREMGWVQTPTTPYQQPVQRIAVRCRKKNRQWGYAVLLSTLTPSEVLWLTGQPDAAVEDPVAVLYAYVKFYDLRGGGVETEIKEDKQGLGTKLRYKKRFAAQAVLLQLEVLAHNLIRWARRWLAPHCPTLQHWGIVRFVRDVFRVHGKLVMNQYGQILHIVLNQADPLAAKLGPALASLLEHQDIAVTLGEI